MLTNVQQDVHNNIVLFQLGRLEMLFIKPPLRLLLWPNFENARKLSIKIPCQCIFLGGKPTLALLEGKLTKGETVIYVCQNKSCQRPPLTLKKP
jgi:hypothetical protein